MCLAVFSWQPNAQYPLQLVANRDEFRHRPTQEMHLWPEGILAGKDLSAGGTWLGFNPDGRFALLTNIRSGYIGLKRPKSRGELVTSFLLNSDSIADFHQTTVTTISEYGGFNLIIGNSKELFWFSSDNPEGQWLQPGIYGLSNAALDTPWPKLRLAKKQMQHYIQMGNGSLTEHNILCSTQPAQTEHLPHTGVPLAWELKLSAQTILGDDYGTQCRTHVRQNKLNQFEIEEHQLNHSGDVVSSQRFLI